MATIRFSIGAANEADITGRDVTFTGKESAPVTVHFDGAGASSASTPELTGTYAVGDQLTDVTLTQTNANGTSAAVTVPPLTLTNGNQPAAPDVSTLTAALVS